MILSCTRCQRVYRSVGDPQQDEQLLGEKSDWWPDKYVCPVCDGVMFARKEADVMAEVLASPTLQHFPVEELYAAMSGLGLPEQRLTGPQSVRAVLEGKRIRSVSVQPAGTSSRSVLDRIVLDDGTVIYLASGSYGATVYRIRGPACS